MHCRNCGTVLGPSASVCTACGVLRGRGVKFCPNCAAEPDPSAAVCVKCGVALNGPGYASITAAGASTTSKSKVTAGLLGIFLGGFGIHRFYLGYTTIGVVQIFVTIFTLGFGALWGFVEGILIFAGSIRTDSAGVPLID
jgi:TM2 domain-containing membrane protein YozV